MTPPKNLILYQIHKKLVNLQCTRKLISVAIIIYNIKQYQIKRKL